jgi:hypothetical protein
MAYVNPTKFLLQDDVVSISFCVNRMAGRLKKKEGSAVKGYV